MSDACGILAIWNDRDEAIAPVYERWYVNEHVPERLAVPGFLSARRYERIDGGSPQFFTSYELRSVDVLSSTAYLERLAAPSELTRATMARFRNMVRTACIPVRRSAPGALGSCVALAWIPQPAARCDQLLALAGEYQRDPRVVNVQVWRAAPDAGSSSAEAALRPGGDARIEAAIVLDAMREADARELAAGLAAALGTTASGTARSGAYRLLAQWRHTT
jgi:hypothetical protein